MDARRGTSGNTPARALLPAPGARRLTRRRLLAGAGALGAGLAGATLLGCSGSNAKPDATATTPAAAAVVPRRGGTWRFPLGAEPPTLDPLGSKSAITKTVAAAAYSRLFAYEAGPGRPKVSFETVPDAARTIEAPDALTYVVTLDPRAWFTAPLSSQLLASDVRFTYERFVARAAAASPGVDADVLAMVDRVETPDDQTVVFRLKEPYAVFAQVLADARGLQLMPAETGRAFNAQSTMVGSGPWLFDEYRPGNVVTYVRNPDWHGGPERPYFDALEMHIARDAGTAMTQFLGGDLDVIPVSTGEVKRVMDAVKGVELVENDVSSINNITFSDIEAVTPWRDARVRRAVSMSLDREEMLDVAYGVKDLQSLGLDASRAWNGFLPWGLGGYWLDPKRMRPENAASFKYAPAEAARLLDAAGYRDGLATEWHYTSGYRGGYPALAEMVPPYLRAAKIVVKPVVEDFASSFMTLTFAGNFRGLASIAHSLGEPGNYLAALYVPRAARNTGKVNDPRLTEMIRTLQANPRRDERRQQIIDVQDYLATQMYSVPLPIGPTYTAYQASARNVADHQSHGAAASVDQVAAWWKA